MSASFGQSLFSSSSFLLPEGLPLDGWDGFSLLGFLEGPNAGKLLFENCGDVAHGSSDTGIGASATSSFSDPAGGLLSMSASVQMAPTNALTAPLGEVALISADQLMSSTFTPVIAPGDQNFTVAVTYTIASATASSPQIGSAAEADVDYLSGPQAPSCAGQPINADQTGTLSTGLPGTYTALFTFSCPAGQALTASESMEVVFAETQSALGEATSSAQSFSASISAKVDSATVTYG